MCAGGTKGTLRRDFHLLRKYFSLKLYKIFNYFFYENLLINIVYYLYIDLYIHIYIPIQAISVANLGFNILFL